MPNNRSSNTGDGEEGHSRPYESTGEEDDHHYRYLENKDQNQGSVARDQHERYVASTRRSRQAQQPPPGQEYYRSGTDLDANQDDKDESHYRFSSSTRSPKSQVAPYQNTPRSCYKDNNSAQDSSTSNTHPVGPQAFYETSSNARRFHDRLPPYEQSSASLPSSQRSQQYQQQSQSPSSQQYYKDEKTPQGRSSATPHGVSSSTPSPMYFIQDHAPIAINAASNVDIPVTSPSGTVPDMSSPEYYLRQTVATSRSNKSHRNDRESQQYNHINRTPPVDANVTAYHPDSSKPNQSVPIAFAEELQHVQGLGKLDGPVQNTSRQMEQLSLEEQRRLDREKLEEEINAMFSQKQKRIQPMGRPKRGSSAGVDSDDAADSNIDDEEMDEELKMALEQSLAESKKMQQLQQQQQQHFLDASNESRLSSVAATGVTVTKEDVEEMNDFHKELRRNLVRAQAQGHTSEEIKSLVDVCRRKQKLLRRAMDAMSHEDDDGHMDMEFFFQMITINDEFQDAIHEAEQLPDPPSNSGGDDFFANSSIHINLDTSIASPNNSSQLISPTLSVTALSEWKDNTSPSVSDVGCNTSNNVQQGVGDTSATLDIKTMIENKDVFNLICMLLSESKLQATEALMTMAKNNEYHQEIISSGGLHSLLNVFQSTNHGNYHPSNIGEKDRGGKNAEDISLDINSSEQRNSELRRASALAVAYLVPSSSDRVQVQNINFDISLMDCLKYLIMDSHSKQYEKDREVATIALAHRWINCWTIELQQTEQSFGGSRRSLKTGSPDRRRQRQQSLRNMVGWEGSSNNGINRGVVDGTQLMLSRARRRAKDLPLMETQEAKEVMEKAVALIVLVARSFICDSNAITAAAGGSRRPSKKYRSNELTSAITLVVESMCAVEAIRSIVAREGLLEVLVEWLQHGAGKFELERCASHSLMCLLSTNQHDPYLSGWIHSQVMTNEAAIPSILRLAHQSDRGEMRLAAANIIAALALAPQTSEAIVEAGGPCALVNLLQGSIRSRTLVPPSSGQKATSEIDMAMSAKHLNSRDVDFLFHFDTTLAHAAASGLLTLVARSMSATTARGWLHHELEGNNSNAYGGSKASSTDVMNNHVQYNIVDDIVDNGVLLPLSTVGKSRTKTPARTIILQLLALLSDNSRLRPQLIEAEAAMAFAGSSLHHNIQNLMTFAATTMKKGPSTTATTVSQQDMVEENVTEYVDDKAGGTGNSYSHDDHLESENFVLDELFYGLHGLTNLLEPISTSDSLMNRENIVKSPSFKKGDPPPIHLGPFGGFNQLALEQMMLMIKEEKNVKHSLQNSMTHLFQLASLAFSSPSSKNTKEDEGRSNSTSIESSSFLLWTETSGITIGNSSIGMMDVLLEAYRALRCICPLLLSKSSVKKGYAVHTKEILLLLCDYITYVCSTLIRDNGSNKDNESATGKIDDGGSKVGQNLKKAMEHQHSSSSIILSSNATNVIFLEEHEELLLDALSGIRSLASYAPLRDAAVEWSLKQLFQMKHLLRNEAPKVAQASHQVCVSLQFSKGDLDRAGNDISNVLDWWGFERSIIIQLLSLDELFWSIYYHWKDAFSSASKKVVIETFGDELDSSEREAETAGMNFFKKYFRNVTSDAMHATRRKKVVDQYRAVYQDDHDGTTMTHYRSKDEIRKNKTFHRFYNKDWILAHDESTRELANAVPGCFDEFVPDRVQHVLDYYMPSRAIQSSVLPLFHIQPSSCFDFRTVSMPEEHSYYSFRREGQILSRLCDEFTSSSGRGGAGGSSKTAAGSDKKHDTHWSLSFVNSTFGGEFAETLVHALYRCPVINALSFSTVGTKWKGSTISNNDIVSEDNNEVGEGGEDFHSSSSSSPLPRVVGSLPPWITHLTLDNVLDSKSLVQFLDVYVSMGKALAKATTSNGKQISQAGLTKQAQSHAPPPSGSNLQALSIKNTPCFHDSSADAESAGVVLSLAETLWCGGFPSLKVLDLSGNLMGDDMCGRLLAALYANDSKACGLETLDLSNNLIRDGEACLDALSLFVGDRHLINDDATLLRNIQSSQRRRRQPVQHLFLSQNELSFPFVSELLSFLRGDALNLATLNLADNNLTAETSHRLSNVFKQSLLRNTTLNELNLSKNKLNLAFLEATYDAMCSKDSWSQLAFIRLETNIPPYDEQHIAHLNESLKRGRKEYVERIFGPPRPSPQQQEEEVDSAAKMDGDYVVGETHQDPDRVGKKSRKSYRQEMMSVGEQMDKSSEEKNGFETELHNEDDAGHHHVLDSEDGTASDLTMSTTTVVTKSSKKNKLTVLFSAPLCCRLADNTLKPIDVLDLELERDLLFNCFKEASQDIELEFDTATTDRLSACLSKKRSSCLHFSGHGHPNFLTFEDGKGGLHGVKVEHLKQRLLANGGKTPFQFVFVSACHSLLAGQTFVDAGVPHVVCCKQETQIMDSAALAFTRSFYLSLAVGNTVAEAFEVGRQNVAMSPTVPNSTEEMKKFVLLPRDGNHDHPVFEKRTVAIWPVPSSTKNGGVHIITDAVSLFVGNNNGPEGDSDHHNHPYRNYLPSPPQGFIGREVDMYLLLNEILSRRLVTLVGLERGLGASSLATSVCHYINDRKSTMNHIIETIIYLRYSSLNDEEITDEHGGDPSSSAASQSASATSLIHQLYKQIIVTSSNANTSDERGNRSGNSGSVSFNEMVQNILRQLRHARTLLVFDIGELEDATINDTQTTSAATNGIMRNEPVASLVSPGGTTASSVPREFIQFLSSLFRETKYVKVLIVGHAPLGVPSALGGVGEHTVKLGPLTFRNTVKLFTTLCPHLHNGSERHRLARKLCSSSNSKSDADRVYDDPMIQQRSKLILERLGRGNPSKAFDAAYQCTKEDMLRWCQL